MTLVPVRYAMLWPYGVHMGNFGVQANSAIDAATEKVAHIGRIYLATGAGTSKTISAAGGGSINFRLGSVTFANGSTSLDIGLQDVSASGPPFQPDGTFDVHQTLTGGGGGITANAWNSLSMTGGTGSKTIAHGDMVALVLDMTARGGADSVSLVGGATTQSGALTPAFPGSVLFTVSWVAQSAVPSAVITFDDGTLGWFDYGYPISATLQEGFQDSTNPDERGMIFQVPFDCEIDAFWANGQVAAGSDHTFNLYSDPLGTPSSVASLSVLAEQRGSINAAILMHLLASEVSVSRNTNYCVAIRATGAANYTQNGMTIGDEDYRAYWPAGATMAKATRNDGSGAFTAESPAVSLYQMGVRISSIHDTDGGGSAGGARIIGGTVVR